MSHLYYGAIKIISILIQIIFKNTCIFGILVLSLLKESIDCFILSKHFDYNDIIYTIIPSMVLYAILYTNKHN